MKNKQKTRKVHTLIGTFNSEEEWLRSYKRTLRIVNYSFIAITIGFIIGTIIQIIFLK